VIPDLLDSGFATALGGGVAAVLGVVVGWLLRVSGSLTCYSGHWDISFEIEGGDELGQPTKKYDELEEGDRVGRARFVLPLDLFNPKEVPVGLREVRIEMVREDGTRLPVKLHDTDATKVFHSLTIPGEEADVLNLPSRQFLRVRLGGFLDAEDAKTRASGRCRKVEFVGEPPKRRLLPTRTFRRTIAKP